jgi:hypothetical protein
MNRVLNTLLLWLLIATLPTQGFAAAMKTVCGPAHHVSVQINVAHADHQHKGKAGHDHHQDASVHSASYGLSPDLSVAGKSPVKHEHESAFCSVCATCCVGAVAPPSVPILTPVHGSSEFVIATPSPLVTGYIPAGLERPPKTLSA